MWHANQLRFLGLYTTPAGASQKLLIAALQYIAGEGVRSTTIYRQFDATTVSLGTTTWYI